MPPSRSKKYHMRKGAIKRILPGILLTILAVAAYVFYLNNQERSANDHFIKLRRDNPTQYLNEIRQVRGFSKYVTEYGELKGFSSFKIAAPEFLLGRWAIFDEPQQVSDKFTSSVCSNPLLIENGRVTIPPSKTSVAAKFKLDGTMLRVKPAVGSELRIDLVGAGIFLHHIEIKNMDGTTRAYGYRCR